VVKRFPKRASKPPKALAFGGLNMKFGALLTTESAQASLKRSARLIICLNRRGKELSFLFSHRKDRRESFMT
jgi:hypothetical protein